MNLFEKLGEQAIALYLLFFIYSYMTFNNKFSLVMFIMMIVMVLINMITKSFLITLFSNKTLNHRLPILGSFCRPNDPNCEKLTMTGYGMPSGHSQTTIFLPAFYYFYFRDRKDFSYPLFITFSMISALVMISRYTSEMHSIQQIVIGALYGIMLAYISAHLIKPFNFF